MYTLIRDGLAGAGETEQPASRRHGFWPRVSRTVLLLGLTSLFTDISSEMVSSILPLYFVLHLRFSPLSFGVIDGLYQGSAALVRLAGGFVADRWRRHKEVAVAGYGLSALCKLGLLAAGGTWTAIAAVIMLDRTGKGVRTAPRDALISLNSPRQSLGTAFGVHRALDTVGALLGPLIAFGLLTQAPGAFDAVFVVSFCAALIGLGILILFVENRTAEPAETSRQAASLRAVAGLLTARRFFTLALVGGALSLATISDGFLYLMLQRRLDFGVGFFPLLYVATALVYFVFAVPAGRLADRIGRGRVFVGGYALLLGVYVALLRPSIGYTEVFGYVLLFGAFYAATDGVLMAIASAMLPEELRTSGLALLTTITNLARLFGSILFGALWTWRGPETAVFILLTGLLIAIAAAAATLARAEDRTIYEQTTTP
jgi:MFS family permease